MKSALARTIDAPQIMIMPKSGMTMLAKLSKEHPLEGGATGTF
jgi:hypothetical protein